MTDGLKWWQIRDHQGFPLHPSPEQEKLEKEMAEKASAHSSTHLGAPHD